MVIDVDPELPGTVLMASVQPVTLLPQPEETSRSDADTSCVLLLRALTVSGPVPVTENATGAAEPVPAVNSWLAPELTVMVGAAGSVTVTIIVAGAGRLAPSRAETVTLAEPI
jgi:hypothetical protein